MSWSERVSYVLVFLVGALRAVRAVWELASVLRPQAASHRLLQTPAGPLGHAGRYDHHHDHRHAPDCSCGHAHGPSVEQIAGATTIRTTLGLILSIGLRPCSGAVLVLAFAQAIGLEWAGVAAIAAMSTGTALAVASLAFLAVNARRWAATAVGEERSRHRVGAGGVALRGGTPVRVIGLPIVLALF